MPRSGPQEPRCATNGAALGPGAPVHDAESWSPAVFLPRSAWVALGNAGVTALGEPGDPGPFLSGMLLEMLEALR